MSPKSFTELLNDAVRQPLIMGIINVTPDSFSGEGLMGQRDFIQASLDQARRMVTEGAAILDIGGESSRPGAIPISADEEISRVRPVIEALRREADLQPIAIAIDTVKASVAEAALDAGASMINDVSALSHDDAMGKLAATRNVHVVLMHNRGRGTAVIEDITLGAQFQAPAYDHILDDVKRDLMERIAAARAAGLASDKIILDPGLGFGKTVQQNLALINHLDQICALGFPVLVGPSRKSFIGQLLQTPVDDRIEGTAALAAASVLRGASIIRVHDVHFMARVARMAAAVRDS
jgi:dihydropteroate synthase